MPEQPKRKLRERKLHRRPAWGKIVVITLLTAALAAAWRYTPLAELVTPQRIAGWARALKETTWGPVAVVLAYTPAAFLMFPRPLLTLATVIAFGARLGITYAMAGIMVAALATYYAGRILPYDTVRRWAGDKLDAVVKVLREHGVLGMFALNMVPFPPFSVQGAIAGAIRMNVWHYTLGSFLGMLPGALATTVFGKQLAAALEDPADLTLWVLGVTIVVFAAFTYLVRRWFAKHAAD